MKGTRSECSDQRKESNERNYEVSALIRKESNERNYEVSALIRKKNE